MANDGPTVERFVTLKQYNDALAKYIKGEIEELQLMKVEKTLTDLFRPRIFAGPDGLEVGLILDFLDSASVVEEHIGKGPDEMSALRFINELQRLEKRFSKMKAHG